jgi:hypothetical protein
MRGFKRQANYVFDSIRTISYWRYAAFSAGALAQVLTFVGAIYLLVEMLDFFGIYERDQYAKYAIFIVLAVAFIATVFTRRPITRTVYKLPKMDLAIEVRIDDIFAVPGQIVVSSNTTFDTDTANGVIALDSLQGQFNARYYPNRLKDLDEDIDRELEGVPFEEVPNKVGKSKRYPVGSIARVNSHGQTFLFLAMAHMSEAGNARSSLEIIDESLSKLWEYINKRSELEDIVIPVLGTGRGRLKPSRKKMIERIAQSFVDASRDATFSGKLIIVVHPPDAARFEINLFEIRDHLSQNLQV